VLRHTTVLFRQETKLQEATSCLVSMGREIQKNNSLFQAVLFLALLSKFSLNNNNGAGQSRSWISIPGEDKYCCILPIV
jgi:hypothetical protein